MTSISRFLLAATVAGLASTAQGGVLLDFENIAPYPNASDVQVLGFYNGGTSSIGSTGANVGVQFSATGLLKCLNSKVTTCSDTARDGVGQANSRTGALHLAPIVSGPDIAPFASQSATLLSLDAGFKTQLSFAYVSSEFGGSVAVYDGADGQGTLLGLINLAPNALGCPDYNATACPFQSATLLFGGTARSAVFTGYVGDISFDDVLLGVPEPASWAMLIGGFGLTGAALRRRRALAAA